MKLTMLGTGNAGVTECYNTCFIIEDNNKYFMVDGGGGNAILRQLKKARISLNDIKDIFVTHKHVDHVLGIIWVIRMICQNMNKGSYEGDARIYAHKELAEIIKSICMMLLNEKQSMHIGKRLHIIGIEDGQEIEIIGHRVKFFDIHSTKDKQFGFTMDLNNGEKLTCCGDEPYNEYEREYVYGSKWLLHEAFCLYSQAEEFKPYEKHHSTVKDACQLAMKLKVENLILYHTEDKNIARRKELYGAEGKEHYSGNLFIPDDLEEIQL